MVDEFDDATAGRSDDGSPDSHGLEYDSWTAIWLDGGEHHDGGRAHQVDDRCMVEHSRQLRRAGKDGWGLVEHPAPPKTNRGTPPSR